ncbi:alpha-tocopherol transfer protein-like [Dermacentor albipictus]|uniref:alpha-tocopherol transfer protein-like n=1 Tax=Dermacentor albipictus TaxID=60249 RepID=UPI0038FCE960
MSAVTWEASAALESLEDVARRELGETPTVKQTALEDLRKLISGEPSLCCPADDAFLVKFLRARKYDAHSAFTNIKNYFRVRTDHPELFKGLTPSSILFDVVCRKNRLLTVSQHKDPLGRAVGLLKIGAWNTGICTLNDFLRLGLAGIEYFLLREDFQIKGVVAILDLKGLNVYHMAHFSPSVIRMLLGLIQDCLPLRLKGLYVINNPPIFDFFFAIAKTFLKAELIKRIRLFGHNIEELRHLVPDDVIPEELGGKNESYDYDALEKELESAECFYQALGSYGYREALTEMAPEPNSMDTDEELSSENYVHL